uniref:uncharacterized protein LOC122590609 n=1 Tax=Erigeron canadensis TaxID=72917 RepID=UPI001CB89169|nr:uncharacterized protein LOC122590609 [Erigeron canadensis]
MGGVKGSSFHNYIILENLEKDLCPTLMVHFIREQTSLTGQAYVFPSLTMETYARGAIVADNISNLKRICDFISNPNHLIVSLSGRPWVIAEDMLRTRSFNLNSWSLQPRFENIYTRSELKVVRLGTEEYMRAKALKDLYMEFCNHLNGLAQRLDMEEKKRQPSITN